MSQLASCSSPSCSISYDDAGRTLSFNDNGVVWTYANDAEDRLTSACRGTTCTGTGFDRLEYRYDGSGHRTQIKETSSTGTVTTTDLRYEGDTIVQELTGGTVSRTYATDDTGRIVEVCDPDCSGTNSRYVVVYNGHGDATGLWRQNSDGSLTLANSYTYSTWGTPTTTVASGFTDLLFRFLYVGASDVQWDNAPHLANHPGLLYMHARTYSPTLGRFLQPDPSGREDNLYGYAKADPVDNVDPFGLWTWQFRVYHVQHVVQQVDVAAAGVAQSAVCMGVGLLAGRLGAALRLTQRLFGWAGYAWGLTCGGLGATLAGNTYEAGDVLSRLRPSHSHSRQCLQ